MALSADTPAIARTTVLELGLQFPVLSDTSRTFIQAYNVLHPQEGISRPSVFVINREGEVTWRYVGMSAADRAPMTEVLEQLRAVQ